MPKADDYTCPRCDYHTPLKRCMSRHFYEKKTPCTDKNGLDLTDEIRNKVLQNHRYNAVTASGISYNVNAYIGSMDTIPKLTRYLEYHGKKVVDINDLVEKQYSDTVQSLNDDTFRAPHLISPENFLLLIDDMAKTNNDKHEEMNMVYDETLDIYIQVALKR